jgi:SET domain-containing protein
MYRPLPDTLDIQKSSIEGNGLFALKDLASNDDKYYMDYWSDLAKYLSHIEVVTPSERNLYRTTIGGFINHSSKPNCTLFLRRVITNHDLNIREYYIRPTRLIKTGEELTLDYTKQFCGEVYNDCEWMKS